MPKSLTPRTKAFYVYVLLDLRKPGEFRYGHWKFEYEPFYVGKGCDGRKDNHLESYLRRGPGAKLADFRLRSQFRMYCKIRAIHRATGELPTAIKKRRKLTEKQAFALERRLIARIGREDHGEGPLINNHDGGQGGSSRQMFTKKTRALISRNSRRMHARRDEAQRAEISKRISQTNRDTWAGMTARERARRVYLNQTTVTRKSRKHREAFAAKMSDIRRNFWKNMTPKQLEAYKENARKAAILGWEKRRNSRKSKN